MKIDLIGYYLTRGQIEKAWETAELLYDSSILAILCYTGKITGQDHIQEQDIDAYVRGKVESHCPMYTGVIPATYAGPGQLDSGFPCGKCAWIMQGVNKSLRVEPLLTFKHLLTV